MVCYIKDYRHHFKALRSLETATIQFEGLFQMIALVLKGTFKPLSFETLLESLKDLKVNNCISGDKMVLSRGGSVPLSQMPVGQF